MCALTVTQYQLPQCENVLVDWTFVEYCSVCVCVCVCERERERERERKQKQNLCGGGSCVVELPVYNQ